MGLFKQMKDMKNVVAQAPGMIDQAQQMAAQAQQLQAAQAAQAAQAGVPGFGGTVAPAELEPIAGISLERYAQLSKTIGERRLDAAGLESFVATQGHSAADWQAAYDGWNARMKANMALSVQFSQLYNATAAI